jgi:hypothetical protein
MNKDAHLMFEAYATKNSEKNNATFNQHQMDDRKTNSTDPMARIEQKRKDKKNIGSVRTEDAEDVEHCQYAREGCDCNECEECEKNQTKSEDAETYGVEDKIKMALHEIEGIGYTGDHIDPKEVAKLVVGSPNDWGDSYGHVLQALEHVIEAFYEKGLQDS